MNRTNRLVSILIPAFLCLLFVSPAISQQLTADSLQVGDNRSNEFAFAPYLGGIGTVETLGTFQKNFTGTTHDYRVGVVNEVVIAPENSNLITSKYITFGSYNRVRIPSGVAVNTSGPSEIYGSYSAALNSGTGQFNGRTYGARLEAVDNHSAGSTWGVVGAEIAAYVEGIVPKYGSMGAAISLVNNATEGTPGANPFMFGISAGITNNSNADVTEQAVISLKNMGGTGTGIIPNMYGIKINQPSTAYGIKVQNNIGLFVADHSTIGEYMRYNIYSSGPNSRNYFQGEVQVDGPLKMSPQCRGVAQILRGRVVISSTCVREESAILITRRSSNRDVVTYSYSEITEGASFTIYSSDLADEAQISWLVIN